MVVKILLVMFMVSTALLAIRVLVLQRDRHRLLQQIGRMRSALRAAQSPAASPAEDKAQRLRTYLNFMDTLINTIPNPIYYKDLEGIIRGCNPAFASEILGLTRDRIIDCSFGDLAGPIPAALATLLATQEREMHNQRGVHAFEAALPCADGRQHEFLFSIATVYAAEDQIVGNVGVMLDLTTKNQAGRDRMQKDKFQGVLETAGAICHELNQPLQVISGYAEMALAETRPGEEWYDLIHPMSAQVERMVAITRKLHHITRYKTVAYGEKDQIIDLQGSQGSERRST